MDVFTIIVGFICLGLILPYVVKFYLKLKSKRDFKKRVESLGVKREMREKAEVNRIKHNNLSDELDKMLLNAKEDSKKLGW